MNKKDVDNYSRLIFYHSSVLMNKITENKVEQKKVNKSYEQDLNDISMICINTGAIVIFGKDTSYQKIENQIKSILNLIENFQKDDQMLESIAELERILIILSLCA